MNNFNLINNWFQSKQLTYFYYPIEISQITIEIKEMFNHEISISEIMQEMDYNFNIIYKLFENPRGYKGKNRPHCLYPFSKNYLGIDQEDCIKNTIKILLTEKGYDIKEEINYIDLIAENKKEIWLFEIKGKQTYEWTPLAIAQGLEQCFPINFNENILKIRKTIGFGNSTSVKGQMYNYPTKKHKHISIIVPGFSPTIIWCNSGDKKIPNQIYHKEVEEFNKFINNENYFPTNIFGKYLNQINEQYNIVEHYGNCNIDWCFHLFEFKGFFEDIDFVLYDSIKKEIMHF